MGKGICKTKSRNSFTLDTLGNNTKLIEHYSSAGFQFLGILRLSDTSNCPGHYQVEPNCCLFEIDLAERR
jgi:hypothetical protein